MSDDTREDVITSKWEVTCKGSLLTLTSRNKKPKEVYKKQYGTAHAALCALGRVRHDHRIADQIVANVQVEKIKGKKKPTIPQDRLVRSDYLLFCAVELLAAKLKRKKLSEAEDMIFSACIERVESGDAFTGIGNLRSRIRDENKKLNRTPKKTSKKK